MEAKARNFLTGEEKKAHFTNYGEGKSYSEIAGIVRRPENFVYSVISRFKAEKNPTSTKTENWQASYDYQTERSNIVKMSLKDRFDTAMSIFREFYEQTGETISRKKLFLVG